VHALFKFLGVAVAAYVAWGLVTGTVHAKRGAWGQTIRREDDARGYWSAIVAYLVLALMLFFVF
jgi:hypothetical protein